MGSRKRRHCFVDQHVDQALLLQQSERLMSPVLTLKRLPRSDWFNSVPGGSSSSRISHRRRIPFGHRLSVVGQLQRRQTLEDTKVLTGIQFPLQNREIGQRR